MASSITYLETRRRGGSGKERRLGVGPRLRLVLQTSETFTAQVRGIQNHHHQAHALLLNWGSWSRSIEKIPGLTNHLQGPSLWDMAQRSKWDDWADDPLEEARGAIEKPERREQEDFDQKSAETVDRLIHNPDLPTVWRLIAKALYFWQTPEYQCPRAVRSDHTNFLQFLDAMLGYVEAR